MEPFLLRLLNMSFGGAVVIAAILPIRLLLKKAPHKYTVLLWALAAVRLLCPVSVASPTSVTPDVTRLLPDSAQNAVLLPGDMPIRDDGLPAAPGEESGGVTDAAQTPASPALPVGQGEAGTAAKHTPASPSVPTVLFGIWAAGCGGMLLYALLSYLRLRRKTAARLQTGEGIYVCDALPGPFVLGVLRPRIFLPSDLPDGAKDAVLAHEKAHIRRRDPLVKLFGFFVLTLHWFNPLVWAGYLLLGRDVELAADEAALKDFAPGDRKVYAEALLACTSLPRRLNVAPLGFGEIGLRARIKNMSVKKKLGAGLAILTVLAVAGVAVFLLPEHRDARPADEPETDAQQTTADGTQTTDGAATPSDTGTVLREASPRITLRRDAPENAGPAFDAAKTCLLKSALQSFGQPDGDPLAGSLLDVSDDPALPGLAALNLTVRDKTEILYADPALGDGGLQPLLDNLTLFGRRGAVLEQRGKSLGTRYVYIDIGYTLLDMAAEENVAILSILEDADYQYEGVEFPSGHGIRYTVTLFFVGDVWRVAAVESDEMLMQWRYSHEAFDSFAEYPTEETPPLSEEDLLSALRQMDLDTLVAEIKAAYPSKPYGALVYHAAVLQEKCAGLSEQDLRALYGDAGDAVYLKMLLLEIYGNGERPILLDYDMLEEELLDPQTNEALAAGILGYLSHPQTYGESERFISTLEKVLNTGSELLRSHARKELEAREPAFDPGVAECRDYVFTGDEGLELLFDGKKYLFLGEGGAYDAITAFAGASGSVKASEDPIAFYLKNNAVLTVRSDGVEISADAASGDVYSFRYTGVVDADLDGLGDGGVTLPIWSGSDRTEILIYSGSLENLQMQDGEPVFALGETLYYIDKSGRSVECGTVWSLGDNSSQYVFYDLGLTFTARPASFFSGYDLEVSYMSDGEPIKTVVYSAMRKALTVTVSTNETKTVSAVDQNGAPVAGKERP